MPVSRRRYNGKSADQRSSERREALVAAARIEWTEHGADGVRVRRVCARAGLNDRYFYQQFPGTEDLLVAVVEQGLSELKGALLDAAVACTGSTRERMRAGVLAYFEHLRSDPGLRRILTTDTAGRPGLTGARMDSQRSIARILLDHLGIGLVSESTPSFAKAMYCVGGVATLVESWLAGGFPDLAVPELVDIAVDSSLRVVDEDRSVTSPAANAASPAR